MGLIPLGAASGRTFGVGSAAVHVEGSRRSLNGVKVAPLARAQAYFGLGGAALGLLAVLLPHPMQFNVAGLFTVQAVTAVTALWLLVFAERVPLLVVRLLPASGTLLISASVYFSGDATSAYAMLYLWVGLYAVYFLTRQDALVHIAFSAVSYGAIIFITGGGTPKSSVVAGTDLLHHFVITAGTLFVAALLLLYLRGQAERLWGSLVDAARTDLMTGLRNRRGLQEALAAELERAGPRDTSVSLLVADLDHFKDVNEHLGQETGDRLIQSIGRMFDEATRGLDIVARTGGGEFAIVLPETDQHSAYLVAEQLLGRVRRAFENESLPLTASFGISTSPDNADTVDGLFRAADEALHAAKALGRDRAVLFSPEVPAVVNGTVDRRSSDEQGHLATVLSLAEALDMRDGGTSKHSQTVGRYAELMARELGLAEDVVERVRLAGVLHDIGKVGIPDSILQKAGPLNDEEWKLMRRHTEIGARMLGVRELEDIREWVLDSHERVDGGGYPRGLSGDELPLEARILSVADSYEAMTADRCYSPAIPEAEARKELRRCSGLQFDGTVVEAFLRALDRSASPVDA